jgi:eukaryotic-like serine/threonine-protein kinase
MSAETMNEGRVLAGKYRLVNKLTAGGMGTVWRAEHIELGSPAAVKLLEASIADSPEALARFRREAQSAASIRSTNIVQVFDFGVDDHTPYIAMELLRGKSLSEKLRQDRLIAPRETGSILWQVARAAAWAHSRGIVHRDLKPGNIFLSEDANDIVVKLLDFGIAKPLNIDLSATPVTLTGSVMGTPQYMSPEQASGRRQVDHRTDIWSFSIIAFECLTGCHAFRADTLGGLVLAICSEPMPVPSDFALVPDGFDQWFERAAHRNPDQRFDSIAEAGEQLRTLCDVEISSLGRSFGFGIHRRLEDGSFATPVTPKRPKNVVELVNSVITTTLSDLRIPVHNPLRRILILVVVLGTIAGVVSIIHFSTGKSTEASSQVAPSATLLASAANSIIPAPMPSAAETRTHSTGASLGSSSAVTSSPAPASSAPIASPAPTVGKPTSAPRTAPTKPDAPDAQSPMKSSKPTSQRPAPPPPSSASLVRTLPSVASSTLDCDPEVKNKLGFCPRPGK